MHSMSVSKLWERRAARALDGNGLDDALRGLPPPHDDASQSSTGEQYVELRERPLLAARRRQHGQIRQGQQPVGVPGIVDIVQQELDDGEAPTLKHRVSASAEDLDAPGVGPVVQDELQQ